jgi:hypothetical protein
MFVNNIENNIRALQSGSINVTCVEEMPLTKFNSIYSMHCDCNHPYTPENAHNLCKVGNS